ncbi:MAG TPA: hypothetical protein VF790_13155 [Dissulfurispiraceae bacterium]
MSCYMHHIPGRLRIKSPAIKRNSAAAGELKAMLGAVHGVETVGINPLTGSVLVHYNPKSLHHEYIVGALREKGYFNPSQIVPGSGLSGKALSGAGVIVEKAIVDHLMERIIESSVRSLVALLL